jgi:choline dehydrogenase-like flavoprotein
MLWRSDPSLLGPDIQFVFIHVPFHPPHLQAPPNSYTFGIATIPDSRGWVRLASADPKAAPLINPNYLARTPTSGGCCSASRRPANSTPRAPSPRGAPGRCSRARTSGTRRACATSSPRDRGLLSPGRDVQDGRERRSGRGS